MLVGSDPKSMLKIQGKTPVEIAVSIAAKLIQTRSAKTITFLSIPVDELSFM
jgi:hypothetical protein